MSAFNNVTEKHTHTIAISATDTWFGFSIARNLLTDCGRYKHHITIRCLTKNPDSKPVERLRSLGGEIYSVDYNDEKSLDAALHNAHYLVFVIEEDENRVKEANRLAKAAEKNDVNNVIVSSIEGAGDGHGQTLRDFREVEKSFKEAARSVVILRSAFIQQAMFLWSHSIEEKGEIIMTPSEKDEFAPFNFEDLFNAIKDIMIQEGKVREEISQKHHQKCYLLTGPKYVNGKKLADIINEVEKYGNVTYRSVSRHELEKYLCSLNDDCGCDYDRIDYILAQRDAAYFIQDGLALLRRAIAEFLRGSQRSGKSNYNQGINRLNSAVRLLGELVYQYNQQDNIFDQNGQNRNQYLREARNQRLDQQYLREARNQRLDQQYLRDARNQRLDQQISQNVQNDLQGVYGPNNDQRIPRVQNQRRNQLVFSDSQSGIIVNFVNQVDDVLNRLRSINVENIEVQNRTSRTNFLNNLKKGTEIIEALERQSDIVPLLYNTTDRCDSNYRPFLPLRKFEVELVLDYLDYVKEGKAQQTNDYHMITGDRPTRITEFFEENADCFVPPERKSQIIARGDRNSRL